MPKGIIIFVLSMFLSLPVSGANTEKTGETEGTAVILPGTLEQFAYYAKYEFPSPERDFIFYINENLLFFRIPTMAEANPWLWQSFKTRKRFEQMIRTRQVHVQYESARTQDYRLQKAVKAHKELKTYLSTITDNPMDELSLDLTSPETYEKARRILKLMGVELDTDKEGKYRLREIQTPGRFEFHHYYQIKHPGLEDLEKIVNKNRRFRFRLEENEVRIPWDYAFLQQVTGLEMDAGSFFERLLEKKRLQLLMGLLYRLSDREIDFIGSLGPNLDYWKKIYQSNTLLKGMFILSHALRVKDGRLLLPGGETAVSFWHRLSGVDPVKNPGLFLEKTATMDKGKLNYLFVFSFFLPDAVGKAVLFNQNTEKVKDFYRGLSLAGGEEIKSRGLTLPGLRDFNFVTLLYALKTRDGTVHFPGGMDAWAGAVGTESKDLMAFLSFLTGPSGGRDKIKRFVSIYSKFYHRPELMTPEVIDTLFRIYDESNILVDFLETIPIRKPRTVLNMVDWLGRFRGSGTRGRERAELTGIFQSVLALPAHHARYTPAERDDLDYDAVLEAFMRLPFTGAEAYDSLFAFFKDNLRIAGHPSEINRGFMQFLLGGIEDKVVLFENQLHVIKAPVELEKEISRVLKKQRACALSDLVKLNGYLDQLKENSPWNSRMGDRMLDIYDNLPHPDVITWRDRRAVPLAWNESRESALVSKFLEPYSAGKVMKTLNRLLELKSTGGDPGEIERLIKRVKEKCLLSHLKHYLVTCAYAVTLKSAKPRVFLNHNFTRLHDFYPSAKRNPWNSADAVHRLGLIFGYHLRGGLSRLPITLAYPYSDYMWGRVFRYFRPQSMPMLYNNLDLYPYPSISRAQDYVGRMVAHGKEILEKAVSDPTLRRVTEERLTRLTAGYHYRKVMALLDGKPVEKPLYFSELMRLGETFKYDETLEKEMEQMGSIYYHGFGTLLPHRYRLFPQPLSHLFESKWFGGEMIDELKVKTAYVSYRKKTPPELLGFLMHRHLNYARLFFGLEYKNEYSRVYHIYDTYNYLHMNRILRKMKKDGLLRLK